jgi:hypothetical protein
MTVTFVATEHEYEGPDSIPAGLTEIELVNEGENSHGLILIGHPDDRDVDDVIEVLESDGPPPAWMSFPGGIPGIEGGTSAHAVIDLEEGEYAVLSFDSPEGEEVPDFAKGMIQALTVTESEGEEMAEPEADFTVDLMDYSFDAEDTYPAGATTFEFTNEGEEVHEAIVMRLAEGLSAQDFVSMLMEFQAGEGEEAEGAEGAEGSEGAGAGEDDDASEQTPEAGETEDADEPAGGTAEASGTDEMDEPEEPAFEGPPVIGYGGMAPLDPGRRGWTTLDLDAGTYMFICFVPDPEGTPHMALGMVHEFTVE